jgi:hypothetical protein
MRIAAVAALLAFSTLAPQAMAQERRCPAGRTLDGACVDPNLAERTRTRSILMVQRRVSATHPATLPRADRDFLTAGVRDYVR